MINSVRNTVLAVANKQNFGYISPSDFNLYAKQAQLEIFEEYFYRYTTWTAKQNAKLSGSDYANIVQNLEEVIDSFSSVSLLSYISANNFAFPTNGYYINTLRYNDIEADRVSNGKILSLLSSNLTAPLPLSDEPEIITKILKYVGLSIREQDLIAIAGADDQEEGMKKGGLPIPTR